MDKIWQNLRYGIRTLLKRPGFTAVAVLTLALGIGANTAIFSLANALLFRPLPFVQPDQVVQVMMKTPHGGNDAYSEQKFLYWREHNSVFEGLAAVEHGGTAFSLMRTDNSVRVVGFRVTKELFPVLGIKAILGRGFLSDEDRPGVSHVAVLSHDLWLRLFGRDSSILGKQIKLNGENYTVVGVMPSSLRYPPTAELWIPLQIDPASHSRDNYLGILGRLRRGVDHRAAETAINGLLQQYKEIDPEDVGHHESAVLMRLQKRLSIGLEFPLFTMQAAAGLMLLLACINVANLQLARSAARRQEIAIQVALGAGPTRIIQLLLTENVLLWLAGGAAGVLLGAWMVALLVRLIPRGFLGVNPIVTDHVVLLFALALSLLTGLLFGIVPAVQAAHSNQNEALKEGSAPVARGKRLTIRRFVVIGEVALAMIVLSGAMLLVRSFAHLVGTDPGFDPHGTLTLQLWLPEQKYGEASSLELFSRQVLEQIHALPGVRSVAVSMKLPLERGLDMPFTIEGRYKGGGMHDPGSGVMVYRPVSSAYFETLGIPLVRGRLFANPDRNAGLPIAIINRAAAMKFWFDQDPVGQRIRIGQPVFPEGADAIPREIVGVVGDVREVGLEKEPPAIVYIPLDQMPNTLVRLLVRVLPLKAVIKTAAASGSLAGTVQRRIWSIDPEVPIADVLPMEVVVWRSTGLTRFNALVSSMIAGFALLMAAVGIYGLLSYLTTERTREIGVRMALGAQPRDVLKRLLGQGMALTLIGILIGLTGALALKRVISSLIYSVSVNNPVTFVAAPVLLTTVALAACYLAARRPTKVDPMAALRFE